MKILPGLTFSWKRAVGLTAARQRFARFTGVPTTRNGVERKVGAIVIRFLKGLIGGK
jgi:hypothetical protein